MSKTILKILVLAVCVAVCSPLGNAASRKRVKRHAVKKTAVVAKQTAINSAVMEKAKAKSPLQSVSYRFKGMRMEEVSEAVLSRKDDGKVHLFVNDKDDFIIPDGEEMLAKAEQIILEEKMLDYDAAYSFGKDIKERILDGFTWRFSAQFADGRKVKSSGKHVMPEGNGLGRIGQLLRERAIELLRQNK